MLNIGGEIITNFRFWNICFLYMIYSSYVRANDMKLDDEAWQQNITSKDYNKELVPAPFGSPLEVSCAFDIKSLSSITVDNMDFEANFYLWIEWKDFRLKIPTSKMNSSEDLHTDVAERLWVPRIELRNCKNCDIIRFNANKHKIIVNHGKVGFRSRFIKEFSCPLDLHLYPFDIQRCNLELESFVDTQDILKLVLSDKQRYKITGNTPLLDQRVVEIYNSSCYHPVDEEIELSCISIGFTIKRYIWCHVVQTFAPSVLFVVLSWLSFWLDPTVAPARVALGLSSLLTLVTQFMSAIRELPAVSYLMALDVWMFTCLFTVFASLVEFTWANVYHRRVTMNKVSPVSGVLSKTRQYVFHVRSAGFPKKPRNLLNLKQSGDRNKIDDMAKKVFPLVFGFFIILYWSIYPNLASA